METQNRRLWTIIGAVLLQLVLLMAAFSLGVYVERGGSGEQPSSTELSGPSGPQPTRPLPPGVEGDPQLISRILRVTPDGFEMATPEGPLLVRVDETTVYAAAGGATRTFADLQSGMTVAIYGEYSEDQRQFFAQQVVIISSPQ